MTENRGQSKVERAPVGWGFGLLWVFLSAVGWIIGLLMSFIASLPVYEIEGGLGLELTHCLIGILLGGAVGILQWVVLRRRAPGAGRWVWASIAGLGLGMGVVGGVFLMAGGSTDWEPDEDLGQVVAMVLGAALGGAVTGMLQRPVLRGHVSRAGWWVLASAVGWGLGMAVTMGLAPGALEFLGAAAIGAVAFGAVTGGALVWLLRQPPAPEREAAEEQ